MATESKVQVAPKATVAKKATSTPTGGSKIAVVLVRSWCGSNPDTKETLRLLRLMRKNFCVVLPSTAPNVGMVKKVKDYVTWGEIGDDTYKQLVEKRGEIYLAPLTDRHKKYNSKVLDYAGKKYKPYFRLNSPKKGFGRKGIKIPFGVGGALGFRGEKMSDLILRML